MESHQFSEDQSLAATTTPAEEHNDEVVTEDGNNNNSDDHITDTASSKFKDQEKLIV